MKLFLDADDRYPDFSVNNRRGVPIELTPEELVDWKRVCAEYNAWQERFEQMNGAYGKTRIANAR
jgi:hypothetical protein